jgi:hypothetical protein
MNLPTWRDCNKKKDAGKPLTPLEEFIFGNQPPEPEHIEMFRSELIAAIRYVQGNVKDKRKKK